MNLFILINFNNIGKTNKFDVVLIDTAGRMQDNEPLMRALAKVEIDIIVFCWYAYNLCDILIEYLFI